MASSGSLLSTVKSELDSEDASGAIEIRQIRKIERNWLRMDLAISDEC